MPTNDEIEINGITYVRKQEPKIFDAVHEELNGLYLYRCGAPDCENTASKHSWIRNTVVDVNYDKEYDLVLFTCSDGHRNRLRI